MGKNFQVDLAGVVDLLSRHLYSSPTVYLRELVQNSVDAITARTLTEPGAPRRVVVTPADASDDGCLTVEDSGIGLTREDIDEVLATIGQSSKRDDLGFARDDFLGQFGIGLLSCFLITDLIELTTRHVSGDSTLLWSGNADGTYAVTETRDPRTEPGTTVRITPRRGQEDLVSEAQVRHLLTRFAAYLPFSIVLRTRAGDEELGAHRLPWEDPNLKGVARRAAAADLCHELLGFGPLDIIELDDPSSGTRGFAYVTPMAASRSAHRLYTKHMLLSETCDNVLPEWAFFVRAVLNSDHLSPTASRESLFENETLAMTREHLGGQVRRWLTRTAATDPARMREFLRVHHLGAKAMAVEDDEMLDAIAQWLPFETTLGDMTVEDFVDHESVLRHCVSIEDFRQIAPIAAAHGLGILNAGYAYDTEIVQRLAATRPELETQLLSPSDLLAHFDELSAPEQERFDGLLASAESVLERAGCRPVVRRFAPDHLQALLVSDRDARLEATRSDTAADLDGAWAELLGSMARPDHRPHFILNSENPTVQRLADVPPGRLQEQAIEALYAHALIVGRHPLRPFDTAVVARALPALIESALAAGDPS